jgi:hypothetical protein
MSTYAVSVDHLIATGQVIEGRLSKKGGQTRQGLEPGPTGVWTIKPSCKRTGNGPWCCSRNVLREQTMIKIVKADFVQGKVVRLTFSDGIGGDYDLAWNRQDFCRPCLTLAVATMNVISSIGISQ